VWLSLARNREAASEQAVDEGTSRLRSSDENRILGRLINLLPDAIDLYDFALWEARRAGSEQAKLVTRLGRGRVEALLEEAMRRLQSSGLLGSAGGDGKIPRTVFDLIEPELQQVQQELTRAAARRRPVGHKPLE
jgi:hypothetical protein